MDAFGSPLFCFLQENKRLQLCGNVEYWMKMQEVEKYTLVYHGRDFKFKQESVMEIFQEGSSMI